MKRNITIALLIVICFVLQSTLFRSLSFGGIGPNLLIVLTASLGFMRGRKTGIVVGFFCGILVDIFFGEVLGFHALIYMYIGFFNGLFKKIFYPEDIKLPLILITVSDFLYAFLIYLLLFLLRGRFQIGYYFTNIIFPEIVYTIVITIFLYPIILILERRFSEMEKRSARKFV